MGFGVLAAFGAANVVSLDQAERKLLIADGTRVREIWLGMIEETRSRQQTCPAVHVHDETAQLIVRLSDINHWRQPPARIKYEELVTRGEVSTTGQSDANWKGKIVLVGLTATGADPEGADGSDLYKVLRGLNVEERFGVELHADVVSNLLSPSQLHSLHWAGQLLFTVASVGTALFVRLATIRLSRALKWSLVVASVGVYLVMVALLCAKFAVLLNSVYHLSAFIVTYWLLGKLPAFTKR